MPTLPDHGSIKWQVSFNGMLLLLGRRNLEGVWDSSTNFIVEQLHKKLEFVEYLTCSHSSFLFPRTKCVELKPFG